MASELKPCPFCGGHAERIEVTEDDGFENRGGSAIECQQCHASSHVEFGRKENLVSAWNTRPAPAATDTGLETYEHDNGTLSGLSRNEKGPWCLRSQAEELLAAKEARIAELDAKLETANALVTCCCGSLVNDHDMGSGHSPVDQYHYAMVQLEADNKRLREALERITDWPNGGKNYGQEYIKGFARVVLEGDKVNG